MVPAGIDDPRRPSGGNVYDRRVCDGLTTLGWRVHEHPVAGEWPQPGADAHAILAAALAGIPEGAVVLVDGLLASRAPHVMVPQSRRLRLVVLLHMLPSSPGQHPQERQVLSAAVAVVTTSRWARAWVLDHYGLAPGLVHTVPPGVDPANPATGTPSGGRFLCVGAVTALKGHDVLVDALAGLEGGAWSCVCAGALDVDFGFARRLRCRIADTGLAGRVRLTGALSAPELAAAYGESDLLVLPSRQETYALVVTEALARALPAVATDVGGVPEALAGEGGGAIPGQLVPPGDADALAGGLRSWLADASLRHGLRAAASRRRSGLGDWTEPARRLARVLTEATGVRR